MTAAWPEKVAIVTGGSGGIGRAIVQILAAAGMEVVFTYRANATAAEEITAQNPDAKISSAADRHSRFGRVRRFRRKSF